MSKDHSEDSSLKKPALEYHKKSPAGKIQVHPSKKLETETDLSLAYSPGVAFPCKEISQNPNAVYDYTTKGNTVAVISNGTAVLGLGDIGPLAAKPVMEGKAVLFKHFAGIDAIDLELNAKDVNTFVEVCVALEPSIGGINLEDISAPACFEIEKKLIERLSIPVFHDDQHGTAVITAAALINACTVNEKRLENVKVVFSGAGSAALACAHLIQLIGVKKSNIVLCDSKGVIYKNRKDNMNPYKEEFATDTKDRSLKDAMSGADVFIGLSKKGVLSPEMVQSMASSPIIFALANPDPEIHPAKAQEVCKDAIIATGRSDFDNQVNNVLGFPAIFRAALDVRATCINDKMKIAAAYALAELAREDVPETVCTAYGEERFKFGKNYILPKPFDYRVVMNVAPVVAKAAMECGVAQKPIKDMEEYKMKLAAVQGVKKIFFSQIVEQIKRNARKKKPQLLFPHASSVRMLKAIHSSLRENLYTPVLLGDENEIKSQIQKLELGHLESIPIINPIQHPDYSKYVDTYLKMKKNAEKKEAEELMKDPNGFASMSLHLGRADGLITGTSQSYADCIRPILKVIGCDSVGLAAGVNIVFVKDKILLFADSAVNINPNQEQIVKITTHAIELAQLISLKPKVALISYTNFRADTENPKKMHQAVDALRKKYPKVTIDGEVQADTAINPNIVKNLFPFSSLQEGANVLIFPNLDAGNSAYKLVQQLGSGDVIGPVLLGIKKPLDIVQRTGTVDDVMNTIYLTLLRIQSQ